MLFVILGFVFGIAVLQWFVTLPSLLYLIFIALILLLLVFFQKGVVRKIGLFLFSFFLGLSWATYQAHRLMSSSLPTSGMGWIASIPKRTPLGLQFQFRMQKKGALVKVSWYRHYQALHVGDQWRLPLKLKHIRGLVNFDGFDYQRWAFQQGIVAKAYVLNKRHPKLIQHQRWKFPVTRYRASLQVLIQSSVKDKALSAVLTALSIGSKSLITPDVWQVFQRTGTSHLIAISGLHVALLAGVVYFLMGFFLRCFPKLLLRFPAQRAGAVAAILVSWVYGLLVGFFIADTTRRYYGEHFDADAIIFSSYCFMVSIVISRSGCYCLSASSTFFGKLLVEFFCGFLDSIRHGGGCEIEK